ncbi:MAG: FecCD family ABC transporter permease [Cytophagaceae bacterium]
MKNSLIVLLLILLTCGAITVGVKSGSFDVSFIQIFRALFNYEETNNLHFAIVQLRIPRIIIGFLVGAALSFSGYLIQALVNNPLADPYILGTASGASLGANIAYAGLVPSVLLGISLGPVFAFLGAIGVTILAATIAYSRGNIIPSKLLLAGIAISTFSVSMISLILFFAEGESKLKTIIFWSLGGFERAGWEHVPALLIISLASVVIFSFIGPSINLLFLGESRAINLGLNVKVFRWILLIVICLNTGVAVSVSGPIGFVGLMVPHFVRGIFGTTGKYNLLFTTWIGGVFMLTCDLFSRWIYPPAGIPIGIITSIVGIPFFMYLLSKSNYKFS